MTPLQKLLRDHPTEERTALAAYTLGLLQLEQMHHPAAASKAFERSLRSGLPAALRESAMARRVEALSQMHSPQLQKAAAEYVSRYPQGRYRDHVAAWASVEE